MNGPNFLLKSEGGAFEAGGFFGVIPAISLDLVSEESSVLARVFSSENSHNYRLLREKNVFFFFVCILCPFLIQQMGAISL
jgi:hypothetical protein